jgi:hypothetical protein
VLRPDGRIALLAWGEPDRNAFFATVMRALATRAELPSPAPGMPGPLRFAAPGALAREVAAAGFREVEDERLVVPLPWPGPPDQLWQHFRDVVAPLRPVIDGLSDDERAAVTAEVIEAYGAHYDGTRVELTAEVVVVTGLA